MMPRTRGLLSVAWLGATLLVHAPARADTPAGDDVRAQADVEFNEAKALLAQGQTAAACAKFARSQDLDPKVGRLLNLAFCHEQEGKTASAWSEYNSAAALATQKGQPDRVDFARDHAAAVGKKLSFVQLTVPPGASIVQIDGAGLARDRWQMPVPLDPGDHVVVVKGANKKPATLTVTVAAAPGVQAISIPALEDREQAAPPPPVAAESKPPEPEIPAGHAGTPSKIPAYIAGGVALVGFGMGTVGGLLAMSKKRDADASCQNKLCDATGRALINDAQGAAMVSNIGFGVGLAGAVAAVWLFVRASSHESSSSRVTPVLGQRTAGIGVEGTW